MTAESEDNTSNFPTVDDILANACFNAQRVVGNLSGHPGSINIEACIALLTHSVNMLAALRPLLDKQSEASDEARAN